MGLIDKHFPVGHELRKCFNRNTVKATYCTLTNMKQKIGKHNAKVLSNGNAPKEKVGCNCRVKNNCPIPGNCNHTNVVYQVEVCIENKKMLYYGSTENFKSRYSQHKSSINNRPAQHTTLSSYVWKLKDSKTPFNLKWSIKEKGHVFSSGGRSCDSCQFFCG